MLTHLLDDRGRNLREGVLVLVNGAAAQSADHEMRDSDTVSVLIALDGG